MTDGIEGLLIETHNWGKTVAFWTGLGYQLEFETDHHSGRLRHPSGGPFLFVAERAEGAPLEFHAIVRVREAAKFSPPSSGSVVRGFEAQHWGVQEMRLADPDGRHVSIQTPLPGRK